MRYSPTFERSYRDGEEWKTTDNYGREDLLVLAYVATEAFRRRWRGRWAARMAASAPLRCQGCGKMQAGQTGGRLLKLLIRIPFDAPRL